MPQVLQVVLHRHEHFEFQVGLQELVYYALQSRHYVSREGRLGQGRVEARVESHGIRS